MAFKPNRALLNVNFDGYKLSKDSLSHLSQQFGSAVKVARLKEEQFSYQHVRAFSTHNHLVKNSWESNSVYWFGEDFVVQKATYGVGRQGKNDVTNTIFRNNPTLLESRSTFSEF